MTVARKPRFVDFVVLGRNVPVQIARHGRYHEDSLLSSALI
jgi:hypothetical protein